eukprot:CAMPEP_0179422508 /NCGR_PEP_ID=MMETSP0799-20121207/10469_1 /TAXON_ID=46947 /ORGANISM="Geminigera cryophila, Strain CCMP2564" /LENGTH=467 /DNA_ID=CAMNT_0021196651 /DNA_START=194 /DNA_END=1594 /DNA_ORIENTATION=-
MRTRRVSAIVFLVLSFSPERAVGMQGVKKFTSQSILYLFDRFCFNQGKAELKITAKPKGDYDAFDVDQNSKLEILVCSAREFEWIYGRDVKRVCALKNADMCKAYPVKISTDAQVTTVNEHIIDRTQYFIFRNCLQQSAVNRVPVNLDVYEVRVEYSFINKGGKHLSCEHTRFPQMYLVFTGIWIATSGVWIMSWVIAGERSVRLHKLLSVVPLLQVLRLGVNNMLWEDRQRRGKENSFVLVVEYLISAFYLSVLFCVFLSLAKGWLVMHWNVPRVEKRTLVICMCWIIVTSLAFDFMGGFFVFMLVLVIVIILRLIFSAIGMNQQLLFNRASIPELPEEERLVTMELMHMYRRFRSTISFFVFASLMLELIQTFVLSFKLAFIYPSIDEGTDFITVVIVGWLFRARAAPTHTPTLVPQIEPDVEAAEGGRAENLEEGVVPVCNVVMVIQPGPTGVWAAERDGGGGG